MKILKKRILAALIDGFIIGVILALLHGVLNKYLPWLKNADLLLVSLFFLRDLLFKNASFGKKIMRIAIYDNNWKSPKIHVLIKRSFLTSTVGYCLVWKSKHVSGDLISVFDWEREHIGTRVVDKKVFTQLESIAATQDGSFAKNMTELYNEYLRSLYLK